MRTRQHWLQVNQAVDAAKRAFPGWSSTPRAERSRLLFRVADLLEARIEEFAQAESRDQGKPVSLARRGTLFPAHALI